MVLEKLLRVPEPCSSVIIIIIIGWSWKVDSESGGWGGCSTPFHWKKNNSILYSVTWGQTPQDIFLALSQFKLKYGSTKCPE